MIEPSYAIFDIEADGLNPTKIYCLSVYVDGEVYTTTDYDAMRRFFTKYDVYIGHYITLFDIPVIEKLLEIKFEKQLIDTLPLSWYLFPDRGLHGLEDWGEELGISKPEISDWFNLSIDEYIHRCEEDVKINNLLWEKELKKLKELYPDPKIFWKFIRYIQFKMDCVREQEEEGFKVDLDHINSWLEKLEGFKDERYDKLFSVMPKVPITTTKNKPKVFYKKNGELSAAGEKWLLLLASQGLPADYDEPVEVIVGYEEPNPTSHSQIKSWLFSVGWEPRTFKTNKKGIEVPQISLPHGAGLCESVKDLYEKEPDLEALEGYFVINHRISLLKGFLRDQKDGRLKASVAGFTNTLRFKHSEIVNLPKVNTAFGEAARGALVADKGKILCGSDQASLEDRLKQHYIYPYDPKYVEDMNVPKFDPHLDLALLAKKVTEDEVSAYKSGDMSKKKIRDIFKNGNYACQYGAGPSKLTKTCNISLEEAREVHRLYWERNWAVKQAAEDQKVITLSDGSLWLLNPINEFFYSLRNRKDVFSTLVQGTASFVFDVWIKYLREAGIRMCAQFHDEKVSQNDDNTEEMERVKKIHFDCIEKLNDTLPLNRRLDIDVQFGYRYSEIH